MHTLKEIYTSQSVSQVTLEYLLTSFISCVGFGEIESDESIFIFDSCRVRVFYIGYHVHIIWQTAPSAEIFASFIRQLNLSRSRFCKQGLIIFNLTNKSMDIGRYLLEIFCLCLGLNVSVRYKNNALTDPDIYPWRLLLV